MRRILMVLAVAALLVAMAAYTVAPAFAANDGTCTNNGCKVGPKTNDPNTGSPSGKDKSTTPFSTDTQTTQQNSTNSPNPNKQTTTTCVLLPNGNPKPGQPGC